ncbi:MAG: hypothetical protein ACE5HX_01950 [bacterium]
MTHKLLFLVVGIFLTSTILTVQAQEPPPPPPSAPVQLTPEQEQAALEFAEQFDPEMAEHLNDLKLEQPDKYKHEIARIIKEKMRLERMKKKDPERYDHVFKIHSMEAKSQNLGRRYREADESEKAIIKSELKSILAELFDLRELDRQEEVKRLEKKLDELKQSLAARQNNKARIIERRLLQLIGEKSYLEW